MFSANQAAEIVACKLLGKKQKSTCELLMGGTGPDKHGKLAMENVSKRELVGFKDAGMKMINSVCQFQFDLDVRHFSHEPLARVIAQALPVLDVKFHLHLHLEYRNPSSPTVQEQDLFALQIG